MTTAVSVIGKLLYYDVVNDISGIELSTGHYFELGGQGDGYCYEHQSFACLDQLSVVEKNALSNPVTVKEVK